MNSQPVTVAGALVAVLTTGVALASIYVGLEPLAQAAIIGFGNSVIIAGAVIWTRLRVTPLSDPKLESGSLVKVVDAAGKQIGDTVTVQPSPPGPTGTSGSVADERSPGG